MQLKSVLIRVICGRIPFKQHMNVLPQISLIFTDVLEKTKICVNPRNLWGITFQAAYECFPADSTDIHRCSWVTKICVNLRNLWENTFQAEYEYSPADLTDIHRCSWVTKICVNPRNLWENTFQAGYECSPADLRYSQMFLSKL